MLKLLNKEIKLSASKLSFLFILFGVLTMTPGYPVLLSAFFISMGIFQSFQCSRENNDIMYSVLLPVSKKDVVKSKFIFCVFIELCGFIFISILTLIRMTVLKDVSAYRNNALMNTNFVYLGFILLIFGLFNIVFVRGFFKTSYYFGKPFVLFIISTFIAVATGETLHHIPGLEILNSFGFDNLSIQCIFLSVGLLLFILLTISAYKTSVRRFEKTDF